MRIRITFSLKNRGAFVPFHHQHIVSDVLDKLLLIGENKDFIGYDQYNFSSLKGETKVNRHGLHFFSSRVTLVFSSPNSAFLDHFIHILFDQVSIQVGNLQLIPESVKNEDLFTPCGQMKFLCISPIIVITDSSGCDEDATRFVPPESDEFSDLLYWSTIQRMKVSGKYSGGQLGDFYKFQLVPDLEYVNRLQKYGKKYTRIYTLYELEKHTQLRGYTFPFTMYAPSPVQEFIYENGLGSFTHKGFGMLDVVDNQTYRPIQEHAKREDQLA